MAKPATDARLLLESRGLTQSLDKGSSYLVHADPNTGRFGAGYQLGGGIGWHLPDGTEVDTALLPTGVLPNAAGYFYEMLQAPYQAMLGRDAAITFDAAQVVRFLVGSEYVEFDPETLRWINDINQAEQVAIPQDVAGVVNDDTIAWSGAYGSGLDFSIELTPSKLQKLLTIQNPLTAPPQFIIDGGNPQLGIRFILARSSGLEVWADGTLWNEQNNSSIITSGAVEFRNTATGETDFVIPVPWAVDSSDGDINPSQVFGQIYMLKRPGEIQAEIRIPYSWLETAVFPVQIDPSLTPSVAANADDGYEVNGNGTVVSVNNTLRASNDTNANKRESTFCRWQLSSGPASGDTIDVCYVTYYANLVNVNPDFTMYCEDVDSAAALTDTAYEITNKTKTTASAVWLDTGISNAAGDAIQSVSIVSPAQEVIDRAGWASGNYFGVITQPDGTQTNNCDFRQGDYASYEPTLYIEWTAGGGVTVTLDTLSLTGTAVTTSLSPGAVSLLLDSLIMAGSPVSIGLQPGTAAALLNTLSLAAGAESTAVLPGAASSLLSALTLASSVEGMAVGPGAISAILNTLSLASSVEGAAIGTGVAILLDALSLVGSAENTAVLPGSVAALLDTLSLAGSAESVAVLPGAVSVLLDALELIGSIGNTAVAPGSVAALLDTLSLTGSPEGLGVGAGTSVDLSTLTLAGSVDGTAVLPGAVAALLNSLTLTGSAETAVIGVGAIVALAALTLTGSTPNLAVSPGTIAALLDTLVLAGSVDGMTVLTGAVVAYLNSLTLAGSIDGAAVAPGTVAALLDTLTLASGIDDTAVIPGAMSVLLDSLTLAGSAESLTIGGAVVAALLLLMMQHSLTGGTLDE